MLRPLPNLQDTAGMATLGRLSALRNARLDAIHSLRDAVTQLQGANVPEEDAIRVARAALDRIEEVAKLSA